ncbi:hypothetical protein [Rhizobium leguminosarum]|uniref:hypothetical protein n=1 Tax=Rhizobium leguminosarum TaxID=384 RepID=UPI000B92D069|nr:hypothetical protein [Rhizobium leguminosarum]ASS53677.1 hypothetical protein CHR56_03270 [Rhizobium leguminosarum bv. viciae]
MGIFGFLFPRKQPEKVDHEGKIYSQAYGDVVERAFYFGSNMKTAFGEQISKALDRTEPVSPMYLVLMNVAVVRDALGKARQALADEVRRKVSTQYGPKIDELGIAPHVDELIHKVLEEKLTRVWEEISEIFRRNEAAIEAADQRWRADNPEQAENQPLGPTDEGLQAVANLVKSRAARPTT